MTDDSRRFADRKRRAIDKRSKKNDEIGTLELAVDDQLGETCDLFRVEDLAGMQVDCGPGWSPSGADLDETIRIFINAFPMQQFEARNEECINEMLAARAA